MIRVSLCCLAILLGSCEMSKLEDPVATKDSTPAKDSTPPAGDVDVDPDVQEQDVNSSLDRGEAQIPNSSDPLVGQMYLAAVSCGNLSKSTVPMGWNSQLVTSSGCSVFMPGNWLVAGQPDQIQLLESANGSVGWFVTTGQMPGTDWTVESATASALKSIGDSAGSQSVQKYYKEYEIFGVKAADVVFAYTSAGQPAAAFMRVFLTDPNYILGSTSGTFMGFVMPQAQMQVYMCQLLQIDASLQCPAGGGGSGCSDSDCNGSCQGEGYSGGQCSGEDCSCY